MDFRNADRLKAALIQKEKYARHLGASLWQKDDPNASFPRFDDVRTVPRCGYNMYYENPDEFVAGIVSLLAVKK